MTKQIPCGTKNLSANVPTDEWEALHALATKWGIGIGQVIKRLILSGAEASDPQTASQIRFVRKQYYGAVLMGLFLGLLMFGNGHEPRRVSRPRPAVGREVMA